MGLYGRDWNDPRLQRWLLPMGSDDECQGYGSPRARSVSTCCQCSGCVNAWFRKFACDGFFEECADENPSSDHSAITMA